MHKLTTLVVILAVYAYTIYAFGRLQSVSVKGRLMCHRKPVTILRRMKIVVVKFMSISPK